MSLRSPTYAITFAALVLAAGATQAGKVDDAVEYREGVMNVLSWNAGHMVAMTKGEVPFDRAAFQGYAADLAAAANLNLLPGFPEDSVTEDSDAKDEIWLNWAGFESSLEDLRTQAAKLAERAASGDEAAVKEQFGATRKACKACHDDFKK